MAANQHMLRFWSRRRRNAGADEKETELTLSPRAITFIVFVILAGLVMAGVIPADVLARAVANILAR